MPPINALPANPIPPETIKAPEVVVVVAVVFVTANPDVDKINVAGLNDIVKFDDVAIPVPVAVGLKCTKCGPDVVAFTTFKLFAVTAVPTLKVLVRTYDGATPTPPDAKTEPVATSANLAQVVAVLANKISPTANGVCKPVPP